MHRPSRRSAVAVAVVAALGTGTALSGVATASADPPAQPRALLGLDALTTTLNGLLAGTPAGGLLPAAAVTDALNQILADPTNVASTLDGLPLPIVGQLLAGAQGDQLMALLGALSQGDINAALATLTPAQQQQVAANAAAAQKAQALTLNKPGAAPAAKFTRYRGSVSSVKISRDRKSVTMTVTCSGAAPKGCLMRVQGKVGGSKALQKDYLLARNSSQTSKVKLTSAAAKRLRTKGGSLALTTITVQSSLAPARKTVKVAKPKKSKK